MFPWLLKPAPEWVISIIYVLYVLSCIVLMGFILMQRGRGGSGLSFGLGTASQSIVGASTADNILRKLTKISAATFMVCALMLAGYHSNGTRSIIEEKAATPKAAATEATQPASDSETAPAQVWTPKAGEAPAPKGSPEAVPPAGEIQRAAPMPAEAEAPAPEAAPAQPVAPAEAPAAPAPAEGGR